MDTNHSQKNGIVRTEKESRQDSERILMVWIVRMGEHYRQDVSKISAEVYRELLSDLNSAEIDAGCRRAMQTSEFMPTVATIRNAIRDLRSIEQTPSTLLRYPEVSPEDREITPEIQAKMDELKVKLGIGEIVKKSAPVKKYAPMSAPKSIEDQKTELRRRGLLK